MDNITEELGKILDKKNIFVNEPMKKHTSFKIGGVADYYVEIQNFEELRNVLELAKKHEIAFQMIGNGTNLLVRDGGIRGLVVKLGLTDYEIKREENKAYITCRLWDGAW